MSAVRQQHIKKKIKLGEYEQYSSIEKTEHMSRRSRVKKTWMDRVKKYFQENRETIMAGLSLCMNGIVMRIACWSGKINNGIYSW